MSDRRRALISGVRGQDGSFLAEFLISKGYDVYGLVRWSTTLQGQPFDNISSLRDDPSFHIVHGDVTDSSRMRAVIDDVKPHEVYNLAAQSHVGLSFHMPEQTATVTAIGALNILEAIRASNAKGIKFYQASSSEMFGKVTETPQNELTRFHPRSPYGVSKVFAHYMTKNYRESYDMFAVSGIMFNHESERRGPEFVTRKITMAAARIAAGKQKYLELGDTSTRRDWGYAPDYVKAMWMMLQRDVPEDFVIGTGEIHTVQEFVDVAFGLVGIDPTTVVRSNARALIRPAEVDLLCADPTAAATRLGWKAETRFEQLVKKMVEYDTSLWCF